jgi:hypothetical protein
MPVGQWGSGHSFAVQDAQPVSEGVDQPAAHTLNAAAGDWQFVYVGSMPADPAKLWLLPRHVVKATPVDCEDPDTKNRWVRRHFRLSGEGWNSADMGDEGGDIYETQMPGASGGEPIEFKVEASDSNGPSRRRGVPLMTCQTAGWANQL